MSQAFAAALKAPVLPLGAAALQQQFDALKQQVGRPPDETDPLASAEYRHRMVTLKPEWMRLDIEVRKATRAFEAAIDLARAELKERFRQHKRAAIVKLVPTLRLAQQQMVALMRLEDAEAGLVGGPFQMSVDRFSWPSLTGNQHGAFLDEWLARLTEAGLFE